MKAVFLDADTLDQGDLDFTPLAASVNHWQSFPATSPSELTERIADVDILVVNKYQVCRDLLAQAKQLKLICVAATGTNNIDFAAAFDRGIQVSNCQAYGTASVVQHVFSLMLSLATGLLSYHQAVRAGRWQTASQFCLLDYPISELAGKTLGIIGYGELGKGVARIAEAFDMRVMVAEQRGRNLREGRMMLEEMLPLADVLSLHCPLAAQTRNLIGAKELALMKSGALLINASRGGVVNEQALVEALESGHLGGAGVDVLTVEPPSQGNPLLACRHPNLIVTPHCAWGSREARQRIVGQLAENIQHFRAGSPIRLVDHC